MEDRAELYWDLEYKTESMRLKKGPKGVAVLEIETIATAPGSELKFQHRHIYTVTPGGKIVVSNCIRADKKLPELPRIGLNLVLSNQLEHLQWFGRGPWENYDDRKAATMVGLYTDTVAASISPICCRRKTGIRRMCDGFPCRKKPMAACEYQANR
jgi:beta-galactosidase